MGLFDAIGKLGSAVVDVACLPIDAVHDGVTFGGAVKIAEEAEEAYEETFE